MASKKEILNDLSKYREKSDKLAENIYSISMKSLEVMSEIEHMMGRSEDEKHQKLIAKIHDLSEMILSSSNDTHEYSMSLMKDYGAAIKKISNSSEE
ncbi:hypothetical protein [Xenorhabdus miraniensis]|nr:hypothetical protein [Xenorhabdus miraniensis]